MNKEKDKDQLIEKVEHLGFLYSKQTNLILEFVGSIRKYKRTKTLKQWQELTKSLFDTQILYDIQGGKK